METKKVFSDFVCPKTMSETSPKIEGLWVLMLVNVSVAFACSSLVACFGRSKEAFPQLPPPPPPPEGKETKSDLERVFGKHCCN